MPRLHQNLSARMLRRGQPARIRRKAQADLEATERELAAQSMKASTTAGHGDKAGRYWRKRSKQAKARGQSQAGRRRRRRPAAWSSRRQRPSPSHRRNGRADA